MAITPLDMGSIEFTPNSNNSATAKTKSNNELHLSTRIPLDHCHFIIQNANKKNNESTFLQKKTIVIDVALNKSITSSSTIH